MSQSAEEFIERLEFLGLLEEKVLANLRRQVSESKKPVSPQMLARLLVDQGHLTPFQAKKLTGDEPAPPAADVPKETAESAAAPAKTSEATPAKAPSKPAAPKQEAPLRTPAAAEKKLAPPPEPAPSQPAAPTPAPSKTPDNELGLAPSEEDLLAAPKEPAPKQETAEEIVDLIAVPETAPKPASQPAAPRPTATTSTPPPAPAAASTAPLHGLTPLDSGGLTPLGPFGGSPPSGSGQIPANLTPGQPVDLFSDPLLSSATMPSGQVGIGPYGYGNPAAPAPTATPAQPVKKHRGSQWDSPLMYLGGGGLLLLILALVFLYWVLTRGSADELFQQAEDNYRAQSYGAALANYDRFLANFPRDSKASLARVRRGMCRLRPLVESKDWLRSLEEAKVVLPEIETEAQFNEARAELATLLPDIAAGFAAAARAEADTTKSQVSVDRAEEALKLVNNSSYIPTSLRTQTAVEPRISGIQEDVALARRDINRDQDLAKALAEIEGAVKAKNTPEAYAIRRQLIRSYPDLETNAELHRAVLTITEGEREQVKSAFKALEAKTQDEPSASESRVALTATGGPGVAGVVGRVVLVLARGAVYGLDASKGHVLWRRFVGLDTKTPPLLLARQPDADAVLVDGGRNELVRVKAATGQLVWRLAVGEPFAGPVFGHDRLFVTTRSGRVFQIDPVNGQAVREAAFPQPLAVEPALDARGRVLFQVGQHSNVYVLKVDTLGCESVFYVGQKAGAVVVPPLLAQGFLFVAENAGSDYCLLHVIATDTGDAGLKEAQAPLRLKGRVVVPLALSGRRVLVVTDLGQISLIEIDPAADEPASAVVTFGPTSKETVLGYSLADEGLLWLADRRISKYEIQIQNAALVRKSVKEEGDTFIGPLERIGEAVVHLRQRRNSSGVSVTAVHVDNDQPLWQTNLATPLAGPAQIDAANNRLLAISSHAESYSIDDAAWQAGLSGAPTTVVGANAPGLTFNRLVELEAGKLLLMSAIDNERAVFYNPGPAGRLVKLAFPAGTAVTEPLAFRGGVLQPSSEGRVYLLNPQSGQNLVLPFQPRLAAGEKISFTRPTLIGKAKDEFVVADSRKRLFRVGVVDQPQPHLAELAQVETPGEVVSPLAAVGETLYGVSRTGAVDTLVAWHLPDLKPGQETALGGRVTWGPELVENVVFVSAERDGLWCLESGEKQRWKTPLPYGPLAGPPLADGADFILASQSGVVWRVAGESGQELAKLDLGEPLGAAPQHFRGRLLLTGSDGVLHQVRTPGPAAAAP